MSYPSLKSFLFLALPFLSFPLSAQLTELEIWEIQGNGFSSPYEDSLVVATDNIVTYVSGDRFFMQTPTDRSDDDVLTSDGIMIYVGDDPGLQIGDRVSVSGRIKEYFNLTEFGPEELTYSIDSSGLNLPQPIILNETFFADTLQTLPTAERFEGMRISFDEVMATGPSNNGNAYITFKDERAFREPGILAPGQSDLPVWDGNPELIQLNLQGTGVASLSAGMMASGSGVLSFSNGNYQIFSSSLEVSGDPLIQSVRTKTALEATVGSLNCYVFSIQEFDFTQRVFKIANYILDQLQAPDVLAVQEVRDLATLQALADKINEINPDINYTAYLELGNQGGSFQINNGFLVKNTIQNVTISQWAEDETLSLGGLLHDRPPLLLEGAFATTPPTPIKVLNLHLRSLGGIEGSNEDYVRTKRWEQSISVANIIRDLLFTNLVVVGDFNAFQFSDGYVDVLAQLTGGPTLGAEYPIQDIVDPPITNHSINIDESEQYSFVFRGNAQILDHCLSTDLENLTVNDLQYARGNSDNSDDFVNNTFVPYRASDHDGFVLFLGLESELSVATNEIQVLDIGLSFPNPFSKNSNIQIELHEAQSLSIELIDNNGRIIYQDELLHLRSGSHTYSPNWNLAAGMYYLKFSNGSEQISKKVVVP